MASVAIGRDRPAILGRCGTRNLFLFAFRLPLRRGVKALSPRVEGRLGSGDAVGSHFTEPREDYLEATCEPFGALLDGAEGEPYLTLHADLESAFALREGASPQDLDAFPGDKKGVCQIVRGDDHRLLPKVPEIGPFGIRVILIGDVSPRKEDPRVRVPEIDEFTLHDDAVLERGVRDVDLLGASRFIPYGDRRVVHSHFLPLVVESDLASGRP